MVDTKASILIAFFAILFGSNELIKSLISFFSVPTLINVILGILLLLSFIFLILTIRPVKGWQLLWDFKKSGKKERATNNSFWLMSESQVDQFNFDHIFNYNESYLILFKELCKRRILKYAHYRRSMWFLRTSIIVFIGYLFYYAGHMIFKG
ncbi:hypothetical protein [Carboxylicivirga sp. N1Y90]|uniref:hypothetical protein n=1 Tax=Carboxylicivirga fragile TaxID=3417571 RepID=UPI003D33A5BE|nr:hypothetical protein [Marinilabiliaceae bacterium N1Y90]